MTKLRSEGMKEPVAGNSKEGHFQCRFRWEGRLSGEERDGRAQKLKGVSLRKRSPVAGFCRLA